MPGIGQGLAALLPLWFRADLLALARNLPLSQIFKGKPQKARGEMANDFILPIRPLRECSLARRVAQVVGNLIDGLS